MRILILQSVYVTVQSQDMYAMSRSGPRSCHGPLQTAWKRRNHQLAADGFIAAPSLAVARACLEEVWVNFYWIRYCVLE